MGSIADTVGDGGAPGAPSTNDPDRGRVGGSAAEVYEQFFVPALFGQFVDTTLDAVAVRLGDDLLDVGCGTGIVARRAIERVGPDGSVHGVDPNPAMLAVAHRKAPDVHWHEGVAEALPFDDASVDRTVCQFAAMFFDDPPQAIAEMARVTRPGGAVVIASWASVDSSPGYAAMVELLDRRVGRWAADALLAPFSIGTEQALAQLVAPIDPDVVVTRSSGTAGFASLDDWLHTEIRGWTLADGISNDTFDELRVAARRDLARFVGPDGQVEFAAPALVATARVGR